MSTEKFICGAECGVEATGGAPPTGITRHWSTFGASVSVQVGGGKTRGISARSFKFDPSAATTDSLASLFSAAGAIASPSTMVVRFAIMFDVLPDAIHTIVTNQSGTNGLRYNPTGTQIEAFAGDAAPNVAGAFVPSTGVWYLIDVKMVRNTTATTDWQVDGAAQTQASKGSQTAATTTGFNFGNNPAGTGGSVAATATYYIDDISVSGTSGDYPLGDGRVIGLFPASDGTHSFTTNDFAWPTAAGTQASSATDAWTALKASTGGGTDGSALNATVGEFISQVVIRTTGYVEINLEAFPVAGTTVNAVQYVGAVHGSTTGAHTQSTKIRKGGSEDTWMTDDDWSNTTIGYPHLCRSQSIFTSAAWTTAEIDSLTVRWGYSGDVTGNPILDGVCFEVDIPPPSTAYGAADLTGTGDLAATGVAHLYGAAALTGLGSLSAEGEGVGPHFGVAALTGTGSLEATATSTQYGAAALTGLGTLLARGVDISTPGVLTAWWYPASWGLFGAPSADTAYAQVPISEHSATWEEQLSEAGAGSYLMQNVEPDGTPIARPTTGDVIAFDIGNTRAWTMLVEEYTRHRVRSGGLGKQQTEIGGRGHLAMMELALVYPTMGYESFPQQVDMYYDYRHVEYDDSTWALANHICVMSQAIVSGFWTGISFVSWYAFDPGWFLLADDTHIIWGNGGTRLFAPAGKCYFRQPVFLPLNAVYDFYFGADDQATAYLDGVPIAESTHFMEAPQKQQFKATFGFHILSVEATNADNGNPNNPGGIAYVCMLPSLGDNYTSSSVVFSSTQGNVKTKEYPPEPPGMTPGDAITRAVTLAQAHGDIPNIVLDFDATRDSNGNAWASTPTISTKLFTDLLVFLREVSATYCDIRMDPSSWTLHAYNKGTMNSAPSGISFLPGVNVEGMEQRGELNVANVAVGVAKFGMLEVEDAASIALYGRRPALVEVGAVDNFWEFLRVLLEALAEFARVREEITVQVDGVLGYVNYPLGKTITTVDSDDAEVQERVVAIGVRQTSDTGRVTTTPTLKDIHLA